MKNISNLFGLNFKILVIKKLFFSFLKLIYMYLNLNFKKLNFLAKKSIGYTSLYILLSFNLVSCAHKNSREIKSPCVANDHAIDPFYKQPCVFKPLNQRDIHNIYQTIV